MEAYSATEVRNRWSEVSDQAIHEKPVFIKKTRDYMLLSGMKQLSVILEGYSFSAVLFHEEDGSVTLSLNEIDLAENGATEADARLALGRAIFEYAEDYFADFNFWHSAPNRRKHLPYVLKALVLKDARTLGDSILCRHGNS